MYCMYIYIYTMGVLFFGIQHDCKALHFLEGGDDRQRSILCNSTAEKNENFTGWSHFVSITSMFEGSLEVKLPTIWTDEKQGLEESEKRREEERRSKKRKSQKKEDPGVRKGRKVAKHCVSPMICGSGGRKVGSLKRRVRSPLGRWEMKNCTPLWREAHFKGKMYKTHQVRTTFGSWDVEKVDAFVARSTFRSQKCKKLTGSEHFWTLRCPKSARRCGAKHFWSQKCKKMTGSEHFWKLRCRKSARRCGAKHISKSKC